MVRRAPARRASSRSAAFRRVRAPQRSPAQARRSAGIAWSDGAIVALSHASVLNATNPVREELGSGWRPAGERETLARIRVSDDEVKDVRGTLTAQHCTDTIVGSGS